MAETNLDDRLRDLLSALGEGDASTSELASRFHVSSRTVRNWIQELNSHLGDAAAIVRRGTKHHLGVEDQEKLDHLLEVRDAMPWKQQAPQTAEQRVGYLVWTLVPAERWITMEEISERLYVSPRTLSSDLADFEQVLAAYGLSLERRPRYGIKVEGTEEERRHCLSSYIQMLEDVQLRPIDKGYALFKDRKPLYIDAFMEELDAILAKHEIELSSFAYQNLVIHIFVSLHRSDHGHALAALPKRALSALGSRELGAAKDIADCLRSCSGKELPEAEVQYLALELGAKRSIDPASTPIDDNTWEVVTDIIEEIRQDFGIDLSDDLEFRMNLACHVKPLALRLQFGLELTNPLLEEMRQEYPLAFSMAVAAGKVLDEHYGRKLPADEAGYVAMSIALALQRHQAGHAKKRILIVCASGAGSARLLEAVYRRRFSDCVESVETCDLKELDEQDFSKIDYVLTTVPLEAKLPVPVRRIHFMMDDAEMLGVREMLEEEAPQDGFKDIISPERFWSHLGFTSKEQALDFLCSEAAKEPDIPAGFHDLIFRREEVVATTFGNGVAMPHPIEAVSDQNRIWIGLLDDPVVWDGQGTEVQAVFLISFAKKGGRNLEELFSRLADFFIDEKAMYELIHDQRWETLMHLLKLAR